MRRKEYDELIARIEYYICVHRLSSIEISILIDRTPAAVRNIVRRRKISLGPRGAPSPAERERRQRVLDAELDRLGEL